MRFGRNRESRSSEVRRLHPGYGTAGVGILPKQRPSKARRKRPKCTASVHSVQARATRRKARIAEAKASLRQRIMIQCGLDFAERRNSGVNLAIGRRNSPNSR